MSRGRRRKQSRSPLFEKRLERRMCQELITEFVADLPLDDPESGFASSVLTSRLHLRSSSLVGRADWWRATALWTL